MLNVKNFGDALTLMNFTADGDRYEKFFAEGVVMRADLKTKKLSYPAQIKGREHNTSFDAGQNENLVVFECVNRLLDKGYNPADIELERQWTLGHSPKGGRADICVSSGGKMLFIVECKTAGAEFKHERANMLADGGQLFSYWQQEQSCQWLVLYASDLVGGELKFDSASVPCGEKFYREAHTVEEKFFMWRDRYDKKILDDDVIFHDETVAYRIGAKPLRKRDLKDFEDTGLVNRFEEILRHNQVSDKENAFNRLVALFICKLVDEKQTPDDGEVAFQFRDGIDTNENFQDRLQKLYADGMEKFMGENIFYLPEEYPDRLFKNFLDEENHDEQIRDLKENFRKLKFYTNNAFAFVDVNNDKLFYINAKVLKEVVDILRGRRIIGAKNLQTLGDMFEQLLDKGFKQNEGQFFTPTPIARFIWDSLPLDKIISDEPPKIIDYACGAGHFLTEGFQAVNDCFARKNLTPPPLWERNKIFGVEKDYRLARVSKISLFMYGAGDGKIKFGDGLENYPDEKISPATFDVLVANPPYSIKGFKTHLKLENADDFKVLNKISRSGSEIETLFAERIGQLVKSRGVAAVILPNSILSKDGQSFVAARESILQKFFVRAIVELGSKTFGATSTSTVVLFLERFDEPPKFTADYMDVAQTIFEGRTLGRNFSREIFAAYLKKIGRDADDYRSFLAAAPDKVRKTERDKIFYFGLTYRQTTLVVSAPADLKEQEKFLGYGWSNAKGREGMVINKRGGLLFDDQNRAADGTIAAAIRAAYCGQQLHAPALEKFLHYAMLADLLDFDADNFTKKITLGSSDYAPAEYSGTFPLVKVGDVCAINIPKAEVANVDDATPVSFVEMAAVSNDGYIAEKVDRPIGDVRSRGYKYFAEGDIIIAKITPCMENGKCAIARGLTNSIGFGSTEFHVFRCQREKILTDYLFVFINREEIRQAAQKCMTGASGHRRVPESFYSKLSLPLPPLDVQKKIVDDFNALDTKIAAQSDTLHRLDADIQAKFAALFDGKNFPRERLGKYIVQVRGVSYKPADLRPTLTDESILLLRANNISGGEINHDDIQFVSREKVSAVQIIRKGDILMSASSGSLEHVGKTALCNETVAGETFGAFCKVIRSTGLPPEYVAVYLSTSKCREIIMRLANGANINNLRNEHIDNLMIPLPPRELQEKFAAYVANCEALKKTARARREELLAERAQLMTKYFR